MTKNLIMIDLSIAVSFMILEAQELELGTCWLGAFNEDAVKEILGIPTGIRVVAMFTLGYPDESLNSRPRKSTGQIVCYERYE
ncbi:MAG: nitroreductase family protein [Methanobacterium paludis]|nr:nitroreductase family protein [Methanobacterium paludis]